MSYQVLARKWRPGKFSELVGQEHVVSAISNALDNDRLHHAYLFTGTRGVGKTTIARIFSKSLNCEEGQGANPCGECNTCKEIEQGNYVDLLEIDAASRTKVEDTRELLDNVQYRPTRGRYKVYLIDEVHMLSKHSFNALLKTLEEPPPHVKFLLATTDPQKLPITILSRCLQFNLKAMSREQIVGQLQHILEHEQLPFEPQALALLARAAQGSMRDALSLTDQAIAQGGNQVLASVVTEMLGLMDKNQLLKVVHAVVSKSPADVLQLVNDIAEQAPDYDNVHSELASLLHQIALTQWVPEACKLETTSAKAIFQLAKTISPEQVQLLYQIALQGRKDLPFAADGKSAFEMTLMRMMSFAPSEPIADTTNEIENGRSEHNLPLDHASSSGGPGNVGKQEEALISDTSAAGQEHKVSEAQSGTVSDDETSLSPDETEPHSASKNVVTSPDGLGDKGPDVSENVASQSALIANERQSSSDVVSEQPTTTESKQSFTETESHSAPNSAVEPAFESALKTEQSNNNPDEPPLDAYMDDIPPGSGDDGFYGVSDHQIGSDHQISSDAFQYEGAKPPTDEYERGVQSTGDKLSDTDVEPSLSAEEQLTSTADMLALRQKLKQKRTQDADAQNNKTANAKAESANDIQARFARSKAEALSNPSADSAKSDNLAPSAESAPVEFNSSPKQDDSLVQGSSVLNDSASNLDDALPATDGKSVSENTAELNDFSLDEFEKDMPFSNDEVSAQPSIDTELQDTPPWATEFDNSPPQHFESIDTSESSLNQNTHHDGHLSEQLEATGDRSFARDALDFDTPLSSTYNGKLTAYLNDGSKLIHASQIDEWSNLVEQMPVAGLLKQLVLHASFSREGNQVSLEIDHSQTHLLNDSAKKQLVDAIHHGLGENVDVNITLGEPASTPFALQQEIHAMRHAHAHTVIKTDDTIQALLSTFDASVLTDSVKAR